MTGKKSRLPEDDYYRDEVSDDPSETDDEPPEEDEE